MIALISNPTLRSLNGHSTTLSLCVSISLFFCSTFSVSFSLCLSLSLSISLSLSLSISLSLSVSLSLSFSISLSLFLSLSLSLSSLPLIYTFHTLSLSLCLYQFITNYFFLCIAISLQPHRGRDYHDYRADMTCQSQVDSALVKHWKIMWNSSTVELTNNKGECWIFKR